MTNLTKAERAKLELEYRECCEDWRWRDKYVLDKLGAAGVLFGLLGVALGIIPPGTHLIKLFLLMFGAFFSVVLSISVAKDTYYRDGTQELVKRLVRRLGITSSLQALDPLEGCRDIIIKSESETEKLEFPRKISIKPEESSLKIPGWLRNCLLKRQAFRWILAFYLTAFAIFIFLIVLLAVDWKAGLCLPF